MLRRHDAKISLLNVNHTKQKNIYTKICILYTKVIIMLIVDILLKMILCRKKIIS